MNKRVCKTKTCGRVQISAAVLLAVLLALVGCGSNQQDASGEGDQNGLAAQVEEASFKGREKRDPSELEEYVQKALETDEGRRAESGKDDEEKQTAKLAEEFTDANDAYRAGEYQKAQEGYEQVLESYGEHYGANVNLALALLQQEKNDEALVQALACVTLFPEDEGTLLNVQTAGVACGFTTEDVLGEAALAVAHAARADSKLSTGMEAEQKYNQLWDDIETELYDVAQGKASNGAYVYESLLASADELASELSNDEDAQYLRAYLVAVGTQLGLADDEATEVDNATESKAESKEDKATSAKSESKAVNDTKAKDEKKTASESAQEDVDLAGANTHVGLPYVVADDEVCTIVFTGYHMASENPVAEFEFINNSDEKLHFSAAKNVTGNGVEIENLSAAWPTVEPGEQESAWGSFFATEGDDVVSVLKGDLTQLSCVASAGQWGSQNKATYPLKWEADPKQATKDVEIKLLDKENDVSMTLTKILPASDGIVALEYKGSYKGKGSVLVDGEGWKVNGKDVELLGAGSPMGTGTAGHHYLLFHAKNADDLREGDVETLTGTLTLHDEDGKEVVSKQFDLSLDK